MLLNMEQPNHQCLVEEGFVYPPRHIEEDINSQSQKNCYPCLFAPTCVPTPVVSAGKQSPVVPIVVISCLSSGMSHGVWTNRAHNNSKDGKKWPMLTVSAPNEQSILAQCHTNMVPKTFIMSVFNLVLCGCTNLALHWSYCPALQHFYGPSLLIADATDCVIRLILPLTAC